MSCIASRIARKSGLQPQRASKEGASAAQHLQCREHAGAEEAHHAASTWHRAELAAAVPTMCGATLAQRAHSHSSPLGWQEACLQGLQRIRNLLPGGRVCAAARKVCRHAVDAHLQDRGPWAAHEGRAWNDNSAWRLSTHMPPACTPLHSRVWLLGDAPGRPPQTPLACRSTPGQRPQPPGLALLRALSHRRQHRRRQRHSQLMGSAEEAGAVLVHGQQAQLARCFLIV